MTKIKNLTVGVLLVIAAGSIAAFKYVEGRQQAAARDKAAAIAREFEETRERRSREARESYEQAELTAAREKLRLAALHYKTEGRFRIAAGEEGSVSFGTQYVVPPTVNLSPDYSVGTTSNQWWFQHVIVTEVTTGGFRWKCTADVNKARAEGLYWVDKTGPELEWRAKGPVQLGHVSK